MSKPEDDLTAKDYRVIRETVSLILAGWWFSENGSGGQHDADAEAHYGQAERLIDGGFIDIDYIKKVRKLDIRRTPLVR